YAPGVPLCTERARSASSLCAASSSGVSAATCGADVSALQPSRHGTGLGFFDLRLCCDDCARASIAPPRDKAAISTNVTSERNIDKQNNTAFRELSEKYAACVRLVMACGRGVRVVAEGMRIAFGKNFHHPSVKIIH